MIRLGLAATLIGEVGTFLAYGFAAATLVAPLGGLSVLFTCLLRSVFSKEVMRRQVWHGRHFSLLLMLE